MNRRNNPMLSIAAIVVLAGVTLLGWIYMSMPSHAQVYARCPGLRSQPDMMDLPMDAYCRCWADETHGFGKYLYRFFLSSERQEDWDDAYRMSCQTRALKGAA
jgi:hypothetical protein